MCAAVRRTPLRAVVAAVLVCAATAVAVAVAGVTQVEREPGPVTAGVHRCGFDELEAQTLGTGVSLVSDVEVPTDGRAVVSAAARPWLPIRIAVFTDDISNASRHCTRAGQERPTFAGGTVACTAEDVLTKAKRRTLLELLIPSAVQLHRERLSVQRESGNILVSRSLRDNRVCGQFSIPAAHMTAGVLEADFVLYVAVGPTWGFVSSWERTCQSFVNGRPSVGVVNVSPKYISATTQMTRTVAHEILHALGFTAKQIKARNLLYSLALRGKNKSWVMKSPNVAARVRAQYGCKASAFMELEDQGNKGTTLSHWKRRNAKDELMAGVSGAGIYSAITIAAMEDMGYYRGNYSNAEPMAYGLSVGCGLTTRKCVIDGVSQFPDMFCDSVQPPLVCSSDRRGLGRCSLLSHPSALPPLYRYFKNPKRGGDNSEMDYCPYVKEYSDTSCSMNGRQLAGSAYGAMSRCLDTSGGFSVQGKHQRQYGICADVLCDRSLYSVKVAGASRFSLCWPGMQHELALMSSLFTEGTLLCPSYDSVCAVKVDAALYGKYAALLADHSAGCVRAITMAVGPLAALLAVLLTACLFPV